MWLCLCASCDPLGLMFSFGGGGLFLKWMNQNLTVRKLLQKNLFRVFIIPFFCSWITGCHLLAMLGFKQQKDSQEIAESLQTSRDEKLVTTRLCSRAGYSQVVSRCLSVTANI